MQDADRTAGDGRSVLPGSHPCAAGLETVQLHLGIVEEVGEHADGIGTATDTGANDVG